MAQQIPNPGPSGPIDTAAAQQEEGLRPLEQETSPSMDDGQLAPSLLPENLPVEVPSFIMGTLSMADAAAAPIAEPIESQVTIEYGDEEDVAGDPSLPTADGLEFSSADDNQEAASAEESGAPQSDTLDSREVAAPARRHRRQLRQIGRFRVMRVLGEGAFGTVFLAHDPQLDRHVALKIAKTGFIANEVERIRFLREARAAAQLRHPNIVPVYEFGHIEGNCYIAYQYIEGRTLKSHLRAWQKLPADRAVELVAKLARALHYAHGQGIIHRDMKPDNVLIDDRQEPHITDFGCARRETATAIRRTMQGTILGTPAYMSPEQAMGKNDQTDARTDVWSLGVILMELLTGTLPFQGSTSQVLVNVQQQEPPTLRHIDGKLPKDLDTICQKCLAKEPGQRFNNAEEMADELDRWRRGEPIRSRPISPLGRAWRWSRRNPAVASLLLAVFISLLLGTTISTTFAVTAARQARERALAQVAALRTAAPDSIPFLLESLRPFRGDVAPSLARTLQEQSHEGVDNVADRLSPPQLTRVRLALYALDDGQLVDRRELLQQLTGDLLNAEPPETLVICRVLQPAAPLMVASLWNRAQDVQLPKASRFRAACALAIFAADDPRWPDISADVVGQLVVENRLAIAHWLQALLPVRSHLLPHLQKHFHEHQESTSIVAAAILASLYQDDDEKLLELLSAAQPNQLPELLDHLRQRSTQATQLLAAAQQPWPPTDSTSDFLQSAARLANVEIALLHAGQPDPLLNRLMANAEPTVRTLEIQRLGRSGVNPQVIMQWLRNLVSRPGNDDAAGLQLAGILLALGQFDTGRLIVSERQALSPLLQQLATVHPHPAVHSAAEWLLNEWQLPGPRANFTDGPSATNSSGSGARWLVNSTGSTLVLFGPVTAARLGSDLPAAHGFNSLRPHQRTIPRRFAIASREVTVEEFRRFEADRLRILQDRRAQAVAQNDASRIQQLEVQIRDWQNRPLNRNGSTNPQHPITDINWFEAAAYCRWLGEQEQIPDDQQCYPAVDVIDDAYTQLMPLEITQQALGKNGFRLPTAAEWEYACRAGAASRYPFGFFSPEYNGQYAWTLENSNSQTWPVGIRLPNDAGMFDMLGNACEWCHNNWILELPPDTGDSVIVDGADDRRGATREVRGGSFVDLLADLHSAARTAFGPEQSDRTIGFRIARTIETIETIEIVEP